MTGGMDAASARGGDAATRASVAPRRDLVPASHAVTAWNVVGLRD